MDSGQARAAALINASRRNHFVAGLQKYEAKARQGKAMAKKKQQQPVAAVDQCPVSSNEWKRAFSEEILVPSEGVSTQQHRVSDRAERNHAEGFFESKPQRDAPEKVSEKKQERGPSMYTTEGRGGGSSTEQSMVLEQKEMITGMVYRSSSSGIEAITEHLSELDVASYHAPMPVENVFPIDFTNPTTPTSVYLDLQIPSLMEVDIYKIASSLNVRIKAADMAVEMQEHAFKCARECLDALGKAKNKYIASKLKKEFDKAYGRAWHCIVGMSFGSYVTHSLGGFVYFSLDKISILLFKTTVEAIEF